MEITIYVQVIVNKRGICCSSNEETDFTEDVKATELARQKRDSQLPDIEFRLF